MDVLAATPVTGSPGGWASVRAGRVPSPAVAGSTEVVTGLAGVSRGSLTTGPGSPGVGTGCTGDRTGPEKFGSAPESGTVPCSLVAGEPVPGPPGVARVAVA